jgi:glycosyltransferase involved in cell wall biosynthesis
MHRPYDYAPRTLARAGKFRLAYVGSLTEAKGVGDLIRALGLLPHVQLRLIGKPNPEMESLASGFDVSFAGVIPNEEIPREMRRADAVVVPSRHDYPEGLPGTIYQALAARTPIIASDHPMFRGAIKHEESALIFPQRDERALASAIDRLAHDPNLYARLSANSVEAWEALQLPVQWGELMSRWLSDETSDREWIRSRALYSGLYDQQIAARATPLPPNATRLRRAVVQRWTRSEPGIAVAGA